MRRVCRLLIVLLLGVNCYAEQLKVKTIISYDEHKLFRFIADDSLFIKGTKEGVFHYNIEDFTIIFFRYLFQKEYQLLEFNSDNELILGLTDIKPKKMDLTIFDLYCIDLKNNISKPIQSSNVKLKEKDRKVYKLPCFRKYYYDIHYAFAKIGNHYLIALDIMNHGVEYDKEHPEKHAYHDMDLCLVDEAGNVCAVLPFTVDDQTVMNTSILESSPDEKLVKIKASAS